MVFGVWSRLTYSLVKGVFASYCGAVSSGDPDMPARPWPRRWPSNPIPTARDRPEEKPVCGGPAFRRSRAVSLDTRTLWGGGYVFGPNSAVMAVSWVTVTLQGFVPPHTPSLR